MALGIVAELLFHAGKITPGKKGKIFLFTDGVTEAVNNNTELFSDNRLEGGLSELKDCSLKEIISGIVEKIDALSKEPPMQKI